MIFGMTTFTFVHVALSLVAIGSGFVVMFGLMTAEKLEGWTVLFLATTAATCVTGLAFEVLVPAHVIGDIITLAALAVATLARYPLGLAGAWRWVYAVAAVFALYLSVLVLVAQIFQKIPAVNVLAPTQSEPPYIITQGIVLVAFVILGFVATNKFRPQPTV